MNDSQLHQNVLDELEYEPSINAAHIGVVVDNGVVTLTGHVSSFAEKAAAVAAVRRVKGVRAIAEEMEIRYPNEKIMADDDIAKRAADILSWDTLLPKDAIAVTVHKGWVTLEGQVPWYYQKSAAADDVRKLSGVVGVINRIEIKPHQANVSDVQTRIEEALKRHAEIEAHSIRVTARNGKVTLEGTVHNLAERDSVQSAAWSAPGVEAVENKLIIG